MQYVCLCVCVRVCVCVHVCVRVCPKGGVSYHAVHGEVVVLRLQLHGVLVVPPDLRVAGQEQALVVHDPVKHLHQARQEEDQSQSSKDPRKKGFFHMLQICFTK